ncbi:MarC family protein [uncultured Draconibacterium sp.]|uniref:MarC family protein n=1 Tax=uncultured Draconibacterium sp. TaxID=1573823 RepID=UPI0029C0FFAE|nr:MarC family protein [uncultured Draconibacterium sp.]
MTEFIRSILLLLVLLNPFLVIVYLIDIVQKLDNKQFKKVLLRAGLISCVAFCSFAVLGDRIFSDVFQVRFASFQLFGGIVFLLIGLQFVFRGPTAIEILRGESKHIAGAIAMPVLIGPGTISASVVIGKRNDILVSCAAIIVAVMLCILVLVLLKFLHDIIRQKREELIERYFDLAGRITALFVGSVAIEMIMAGMKSWLNLHWN